MLVDDYELKRSVLKVLIYTRAAHLCPPREGTLTEFQCLLHLLAHEALGLEQQKLDRARTLRHEVGGHVHKCLAIISIGQCLSHGKHGPGELIELSFDLDYLNL